MPVRFHLRRRQIECRQARASTSPVQILRNDGDRFPIGIDRRPKPRTRTMQVRLKCGVNVPGGMGRQVHVAVMGQLLREVVIQQRDGGGEQDPHEEQVGKDPSE